MSAAWPDGAPRETSGIPAIVTSGLTKRFGRSVVVDSLDLDVREGDRYGFLGPNGSGKTTTVRMLLGLIFASEGSIEILGRRVPRDLKTVLPDVGSLVEGPAFYDHLSARTNLALFDAAGGSTSAASRRRRIGESLERVGLSGVGRKRVGAFSLGMRGRLGLAAALLRAPRLLILDEPTNGLDPQGIAEVRDLLIDLNENEGTTVFLSSHLLAEVEALCTRVGILDGGRLVVQDDLAALCGPTGRVIVTSPDAGRLPRLLGNLVVGRAANRVIVAGIPAHDLAARLVPEGIRITELAPERRSPEDIVLTSTGSGNDRVDALPPRLTNTPEEDEPEEFPDAEDGPAPDCAGEATGDESTPEATPSAPEAARVAPDAADEATARAQGTGAANPPTTAAESAHPPAGTSEKPAPPVSPAPPRLPEVDDLPDRPVREA